MANEVKSGFKTTEFWLTLAFNIGAILETLSGGLDAKYSVILLALSNGLYTLGRSFAKK